MGPNKAGKKMPLYYAAIVVLGITLFAAVISPLTLPRKTVLLFVLVAAQLLLAYLHGRAGAKK